MDYEKKYNEALERARYVLHTVETAGCAMHKDLLTEIFPELRESEDERIRKWLADYFSSIKKTVWIHRDISCEQILEWLEKQKEQKPAWSEVELLFRGEKVTVKRPFYRDDKGRGYSTTEQDEEVAWNALRAWCEKKGVSLYDLYPKQEWSEEDDATIKSAVHWLEKYLSTIRAKDVSSATQDGILTVKTTITNLKSLPSSWKPSEEQMNMLRAVINDPNNSGAESCQLALRGIYEQLKKL